MQASMHRSLFLELLLNLSYAKAAVIYWCRVLTLAQTQTAVTAKLNGFGRQMSASFPSQFDITFI